MKKYVINFALALCAVVRVMPFSSCSDNDDEGKKSYDVSYSMTLPEGLDAANVTDLVATITNKEGVSQTVNLTETNGVINLVQGQYDVLIRGKVTNEQNCYLQGTGKIDLYANQATVFTLTKIYESALIFKTIYTAGGKAGYTQDSYFEIVNNSDEVQYLDGVIMFSASAGQKNANAWQAAGITDMYPMNQGSVICFPGEGTDYPLQPGQSVLVANDATAHDTLSNGTHSDLSNADFEVYLDYSKMGDVDYDATNMDVLFYNNAYMRAFGLGFFSSAMILAKPIGMTAAEYASSETYLQTTPGSSSTTLNLVMPSAFVLDAVEVWDKDETEHYSTFLPKDDAQGFLGVEAWAGKAITRKVAKTVNGRVYYQDTNNSSEDFELADQVGTYNPTSKVK